MLTANETLDHPGKETSTNASRATLSMMPDDLLKPLSEHEVRVAVRLPATTQQVPMLATAENAKDFFNGKDLTGWDGDPKLWTVENGEIVGKTAPGIKQNEFLKSQLRGRRTSG